jgi:hypothetical protein
LKKRLTKKTKEDRKEQQERLGEVPHYCVGGGEEEEVQTAMLIQKHTYIYASDELLHVSTRLCSLDKENDVHRKHKKKN